MRALLAWLIADMLSGGEIVGGIVIVVMDAPSRLKKLMVENLNDANEIKRFL